MNEKECWQAFVDRDSSKDGTFVIGVITTGIYCRPSCPARRPLFQNVRFFLGPAEAEQAGFRACQRCMPGEQHPHKTLAARVCRYIEENLEGPISLEILGKELHINPQHLQKIFKKIMGVTPRQFAEAYRLEQLKTHLRKGDSVTEALTETGYGSSSRLYEHSSARLGMTPADYRQGGKGMNLIYSIVECPLGWMVLAATELGICSVRLGDDPTVLENLLKQEYFNAHLIRDDRVLNQWTEQLVNYLYGRQPHLDLPLVVNCTPFQKKVWDELRAIPYGSTRSYSAVAAAIGHPKAVRAVANACASNRIALIIPCHRVIRENGDLGGYRWGLDRKKQLLELEKNSGLENFSTGTEGETQYYQRKFACIS